MKILFVSLGCDKNLVDSEHMSGLLSKAGYEFTDDETQADIIIINSCCFIKDAKEESIETIFEMARYKEEGQCKALVLAGCLAQRYHEEIKTEIPEVDICIGTTAIDSIVSALDDYFKEHKKKEYLKDVDFLAAANAPRNLSTMGSYAYLKIAEGCDKHCTYCIIPKVRGNYRSVKMEYLIDEAKKLAEQGVKELILVAQETTMYGKDIYGEKSLPKLLDELSKIDELKWIRILYCYPEEITDELIDAIKRNPKVCNYLDMPIQHGADDVLRRMGRWTNREQIENTVSKLRKEIPDIVLRTTLITGFPGETEEDFEQLKEFVEKMQFDRLGVFTYSREEDTPAAEMDEQIEEEIKASRRDEIMQIQQDIAFDKSNSRVGEIYEVMIEGKLPDEGVYIARTYMDAPDVDGYVFIQSDYNLDSGDFVKVEITRSDEYDLIGEIID